MSLELVLCCLLGTAGGIITGLVPGIHVNTAAPMALSISSQTSLDPFYASAFICAMSITHTFMDFIPATVLGIPDPDMSLTALPAHSMVLAGRGWEAICLSGVASMISVIFISVLILPLMMLLEWIYPYISSSTLPILAIFAIVTIIIHDGMKRKAVALAIFMLSGVFGYLILDCQFFLDDPLMPVFSGFFGMSSLILSMMGGGVIPEQSMDEGFLLTRPKLAIAGVKGALSGILVSTVPGIGATQATILSNLFSKERDEVGKRQFIVSCCSINTANAFFALIVLYLFEKPRNGALICVQGLLGSIRFDEFIALFIVIIVSSLLAYVSLRSIGRMVLRNLGRINYFSLCILGMALQIIVVVALCGIGGVLLCSLATAMGMLPPTLKVNRSTLMGFLIVPVMIFYL